MKKNAVRNGSITVEAAIATPVFLCVIISIVMLTRVVYTHASIQHALMETAEEMASAGYVYHMSGLRDLHDAAESGMQERAGIFREQMDGIFDIIGGLGGAGMPEVGTDGSGDMFDGVAAAVAEPADSLKNIAAYLAEGAFEDAKTGLFTPFVKLYMQKYLKPRSGGMDAGLRALGIADGFEGLDFSGSSFFEGGSEDIDIVVRYVIKLPVPINVLPRLELVQRAAARAWLTGDEASGGPGEAGDDIWSLDNFTRGAKIRSAFGGNLPSSFPVISAFEGGRAVMIKSMDLTADSYKDAETVMKTVDSYIRELAKYEGQEKPWGSKGIVIKGKEIRQRELLLVIPQNQLPEEVEKLLARYPSRASASGVVFTLKRYGTKILESK